MSHCTEVFYLQAYITSFTPFALTPPTHLDLNTSSLQLYVLVAVACQR